MSGKLPRTPPPDLAAREPAWHRWPTTATLWQIAASTGPHAAPFGTLRSYGPLPTARFDPHAPPPHLSSSEGVGHAAGDLLSALAERFQANREIRRVLPNDPIAYSWTPIRALNLLDLTGPGAVRLGASHAINSGRKDITRVWAHALRGCWPGADGLRYTSSMTGRDCVTLWLPAADAFPPMPAFTELLSSPSSFWQDTLRSAAAELGYTYA